MTPELDAEFGQLARERIARSPWRYRVALPGRRALHLWFGPHAQYYDFEEWAVALRRVFLGLTWVYTLLGLIGAWRLARTRPPARVDAWRWVALAILIVLPRWAYLATLENTEPRYMVEIFPLLCVLGGLVAGRRSPPMPGGDPGM